MEHDPQEILDTQFRTARLEQREAGQDILDVLYGTRGGAVPQDPWGVLQPWPDSCVRTWVAAPCR
ncbi:hypothetical protein QWA_17810 [Alcaligenes faecalis subsp. faecalis NCIB 8687]|nr:hypothetical protein QWA_17810 [Alcaligenes faecalis subsp. faecalis NCIB 8687]